MSGMLASVCSLEEAQMVEDAGVDIIDLKNPDEGALGRLDFPLIEEIVTQLHGSTPISATIGDLPFAAQLVEPLIRRMAQTGVNIIKVGVFGKIDTLPELRMLSTLCEEGMRIVLVIFAELYEPGCNLKILANTGITGMMLDTMDKSSGSLRDKLEDHSSRAFIARTQDHNLLSGLAGSLGELDIPHLLKINPDYLGFRGGLCRQGQRQGKLNKGAINRIRRLIPPDCAKKGETAAIIQAGAE